MDEDEKKLIKNVRKPEGELGSQVINRMNKSHEEMAKWGVSHFDISPSDIVLDIGCGGGLNVKRFSKDAKKVFGIDYSPLSCQRSSEFNEDEIAKGKVEIIEASVSDLPFDDESFDIVTGFETVYFWPDFINDLKEVRRVLKTNGLVFFCNELTENDNNDERFYELVDFLELNIFSQETFKKAFDECSFSDFKSFTKDNWFCVMARKI